MFKVIATAGDTFLGGEDVDARIIDWLVQGFKEEHQIDLRQDRMALQRLKDAAEKAKCELSSVRETEVNLPFIISSGRNEALHLQRALDRKTLEELSADLIERTVDICRQTLADAHLEKEDIEEVLLVGGMTRMPKIQQAVAEFFEREPSKGVHPDESVALGAGIQGAALIDDKQEMVLLDVTPHALGIMTQGGYFEELIPQNTTVPTHRTKIFTTSRDNQTAVKIVVMQGESERAEENELLGEFILTGLRRAPKGTVEIEVTFEINADGIVSVHAKDLETGKEQSIEVTASSGLTRDEIKNMMEGAKDYMVERRSTEEFEAAKQEAERIVGEIERLFPQVEQIVAASDFGRDAIEKARAIVAKARDGHRQARRRRREGGDRGAVAGPIACSRAWWQRRTEHGRRLREEEILQAASSSPGRLRPGERERAPDGEPAVRRRGLRPASSASAPSKFPREAPTEAPAHAQGTGAERAPGETGHAHRRGRAREGPRAARPCSPSLRKRITSSALSIADARAKSSPQRARAGDPQTCLGQHRGRRARRHRRPVAGPRSPSAPSRTRPRRCASASPWATTRVRWRCPS